MQVIFDDTALELLRMMGYRYFCNREIPAPELDPNEGMCEYWEMVPFKTKASAVKSQLIFQKENINNGLWWEEEHLAEVTSGLFGLVVYVQFPEPVYSEFNAH